MARDSFARMMHLLIDEVLLLGSMVEQALQQSVRALIDQNIAAARVIYQNDQNINDKRYAIENAVLIQLATQQPMAHDLRTLTAILEVINELERMGDYAKGIAKVTILLENIEISIPRAVFQAMVEEDVTMLHLGLGAFVNEDMQQARIVAAMDDRVDAFYNQVYRQITNAMIDRRETIDASNMLMWVAHNLERFADRVVNLCERTIFLSSGDLLELDSEQEGISIL